MFKIKTVADFAMLVVWVFLASFVVNFIIDAVNQLWTKGPDLEAYYETPYQKITGKSV